MRHQTGDIQNLLLARLDSIGDLVLFSASLAGYREHFRTARIVLLVREDVSGIVEGCPLVDELWTLDGRRFRWNIVERLKWWKRVRGRGFDVAVNAVYSNNFPAFDCLIGWSGAERRIAHRCLDLTGKRKRAWPFYTEIVPTVEEWKFEIDRNFDLLRYLGYRGSIQRNTRVWSLPQTHSEVKSQIDQVDGRPYAVICPASRMEEKEWPVENYVEVVERVHEYSSLHWFVCGDEIAVDVCGYLAQSLATKGIPVVNLAGKTLLRDLVALIEKAAFCLGNDSAPLHIAAATSTPGIGIVGGGHYGRFYPYPDNPKTSAAINRLPCYHCHWNCVLTEMECITKVSVDSVVDAVRRAVNVLPSGQTDAAR